MKFTETVSWWKVLAWRIFEYLIKHIHLWRVQEKRRPLKDVIKFTFQFHDLWCPQNSSLEPCCIIANVINSQLLTIKIAVEYFIFGNKTSKSIDKCS